MKIAKFDCPQPPVLYKQFDGVDYVYICVNERVEEGEDGREYVYDHAELIGKDLPVLEIFKAPAEYLDYDTKTPDRLDVIEAMLMALLD